MSMTKQQRTELLNRIKQGCKAAKLSEDTLPTTWAERVSIAVPVIPTPSAQLNACLGIGGIPLGRIVEVYGTESSGKTTLMLQMIATAQKMGMSAGYIDMEHALDPKYAEALGVEMNDLFISQPPDGSDALELAKVMVNSGVKLIVVDSIPALVNRDEYEKEITDTHVGLQARMLSQACRQLTPRLGLCGATAIFINQIREKVGTLYGSPEVTPGGRAMKFYASQRLELRALSNKDEKRRTSRIKVVKNKLAAPFRECEVDIIYGKGFDRLKDAVLFARKLEIIQGKSWMTLPKLAAEGAVYPEGELKFQGLEAVMGFVEETPGYLAALMDECQKVYTGHAAEQGAAEAPDAGADAEDAGDGHAGFDENELVDAEN